MEFSIKSGAPEKQRSACIVVGVFEPRKLSAAAESVDRAANGQLSDILRRGDMEGKLGATLLLHGISNLLCDRVLLVGLGREREFRDKEYREACRAAIRTLNETGAMEAVVFLTELPLRRRSVEWKLRQAVLVANETLYRFDQLKSKSNEVRRPLRRLTLSVGRRSELAAGEVAVHQAQAVAAGMNIAKDLGNLPPNVCTPTYLAEQAQEMAKNGGMTCEVLETADMEQLATGARTLAGLHNPQGRVIALLDVTRHSAEEFVATLPRDLVAAVVARLKKYVLRAKVKIEEVAAPAPESDALVAVRNGLPEVLTATSEAFVAQMLNLDLLGAIAFDKGCYTGQEVIARAHYRGRVKRRMQRWLNASGRPLAPGDSARTADGRTLAVVRVAQNENGQQELLAVGNFTATEAAPEPAPADPSAVEVSGPLPLPYSLPE